MKYINILIYYVVIGRGGGKGRGKGGGKGRKGGKGGGKSISKINNRHKK